MSTSSTPRREFLGQMAASAMVLAGAACTTTAASQAGAATTPTPAGGATTSATRWDDSWFSRLTAKHKAVFDSPQIEDGLVLANASGYIRGMRDAVAAGENDVQAVLVMRHMAIPMIFNDAMWQKYEIGKDKKIKAPRSEEWATKNPYLGGAAGAGGRGGAPASPERPQGNFTWLAAHGHILLGCDLATRNYSNVIARAFKVEQAAVYDELKLNLIPGVILQPTGVYAALRAQEAGCAYIRST